ncbi:hypothetical protein [Bradyrhizobium sp. USDA 3364]
MNSSIAASTIAARRSADFSARFDAGFGSGSFAEATLGILAAAALIVVGRLADGVRVDDLMRLVMVGIMTDWSVIVNVIRSNGLRPETFLVWVGVRPWSRSAFRSAWVLLHPVR